jgi:hypothetical protein
MLTPMRWVDQWRRLENGLDPNWSEARVRLEVDGNADRAAALLGPLNPGRRGNELFFVIGRTGGAPGPEAVRRLFQKLDRERMSGRFELMDVERSEAAVAVAHSALPGQWDAALATLPPDWTDIWAEIRLDSSDYLERAALRTAPLNPRAGGDRSSLRFRCARSLGYGASPGMVRRCLGRCDEDGIRGTVGILRALSDTVHVQTQGPVLYAPDGVS